MAFSKQSPCTSPFHWLPGAMPIFDFSRSSADRRRDRHKAILKRGFVASCLPQRHYMPVQALGFSVLSSGLRICGVWGCLG